MFSSRVSPDGRFVTALLTDRSKLMLYDFQMEKWSAIAQGVSGATAWSHDSKFVYVVKRVGERAELVRISVPEGKIKHVLDLRDTILGGHFDDWVSLLTDDSLVLTLEKITSEIYRIDLGYR